MLYQLPSYINVLFIVIALVTLLLFLKATNYSKVVIIVLATWICIQLLLCLTGFYTYTNTTPPRFILLILPPIFLILILFYTVNGKLFIDTLNIELLTLIHCIRIIVEIVLVWLYIYKTIPVEMTLEGRNFDILSGITAPFIFYFGFIKNKISKPFIIGWNIICFGLLLNVVLNSILSSPLLFQKFGFNQPNIAILYFPFALLPSLIVPIIFFSHLVVIKRLLKK